MLSCCLHEIQIVKVKLFKRDNDCNDDDYDVGGGDDDNDDEAEMCFFPFPTSTTDSGQTPLHLAASEGFLDCAEVLVKAGADVLAEDSSGQTPLDLACIWCHRKVAR